MKPTASVRKRFDATLAQLGFECVDKGALRYDRTVEGRLQMFVVETARSANRLHFSLREVTTPERYVDLADFEGDRRFEYSDQSSLQVAIERAHALFETYGVRWLSGEDVVTPAIAARRARSAEARRSRALAAAREHFKSGEYAAAVAVFETIEGELDDVSSRMLAIGRRRAAAN
jgi:hypothetical protein